MNNVTEVMPAESAVSKGTLLQQVFKIGFLTAVIVAMIGWASAIGWAAVRLAIWVMA